MGKAGTCDEAIRTFALEARIENFKGKVGGGGGEGVEARFMIVFMNAGHRFTLW